MGNFKKVRGVVAVLALVIGLAGLTLVGLTIVKALGTPIDLGTAEDFAVLAGAAISDSGANTTVITGDVGLSPTGGTGITVLSCSQVTGAGNIYDTNAGYTGGFDSDVSCLLTAPLLLTAAKADLSLGYNDAEGQAPDTAVVASTTDSFSGTGYTLAPGVYNSGSSMGVPIALELDGGGDPNAVFIFQAGSTLDAVAGSVITLTDSAQACNVFWQVGSSATLGTGSEFAGTIMAAVSITDTGGSTVDGRLLADADDTDADSTGAVTLNDTTVIVPTCAAPTTITVVKTVINDDGRSDTVSDFPLFVDGVPVTSGDTNTFLPGVHTVTETGNSNYDLSFSGDCDSDGVVTLGLGEAALCTVTNDDEPLSSGGGFALAPTPTPTPTPSVTPTPTPTPAPLLPSTGIGSNDNSSAPWNLIIPTGIFVALLSFYLALKKQTV